MIVGGIRLPLDFCGPAPGNSQPSTWDPLQVYTTGDAQYRKPDLPALRPKVEWRCPVEVGEQLRYTTLGKLVAGGGFIASFGLERSLWRCVCTQLIRPHLVPWRHMELKQNVDFTVVGHGLYTQIFDNDCPLDRPNYFKTWDLTTRIGMYTH